MPISKSENRILGEVKNTSVSDSSDSHDKSDSTVFYNSYIGKKFFNKN
jgi:hypothetical protein